MVTTLKSMKPEGNAGEVDTSAERKARKAGAENPWTERW